MPPSCARCEEPTDGVLCEHLVDGRWSPFERRGPDVARCVDCGSDDAADRPVCVACQAAVLRRHVEASAADLARGWALLPRAALEAGDDPPPDPRPWRTPLAVGGLAKVVFVDAGRAERMWVQLDTCHADGHEGRLDNEPRLFAAELRPGDRIALRSEHVVQALRHPPLPSAPQGHACDLCDEGRRVQRLDDGDRRLLADVRRVGWHLCLVGEGEGEPPFAFTVGLTHGHGQADLVVVGLDQALAADLLNELGRRVAGGETLRPGPVEGLLEDRRTRLVRVADARHADWLGYLRWFYRTPHPPALQLQWSDRDGRFPGEASLRPSVQPDLGAP